MFYACKVDDQEIEAEPMTDYERLRAKNVMRNNEIARSLGINALTSMLKQSTKPRKAKPHQEGLVDKVLAIRLNWF